MIDITGVDLVKFVKKVYELSVPQGLGFLHATPEPLTDAEVGYIVNMYKEDKRIALDMDYVKGRACKMIVWRNEDKLEIRDDWYDHTDENFKKLLDTFNITHTLNQKHGIACNCSDCL